MAHKTQNNKKKTHTYMGILGVDKRYKIFWESTNYCRIELHYDSDMKH